jgi:hypothetical protein
VNSKYKPDFYNKILKFLSILPIVLIGDVPDKQKKRTKIKKDKNIGSIFLSLGEREEERQIPIQYKVSVYLKKYFSGFLYDYSRSTNLSCGPDSSVPAIA